MLLVYQCNDKKCCLTNIACFFILCAKSNLFIYILPNSSFGKKKTTKP